MTVRKYSSITVALASLALVISCTDPVAPVAPAGPEATLLVDAAPAATLVECPTDQTVHAQRTIGLFGGTITAGGTSITIPAGAVLFPRVFDVTVPASRHMEVDISALGSDHYQFLLPATVTIDYSRCGDNPAVAEPLSVYHIDGLTKTLLELMFGQDDKVAGKFTFSTGHLSGYAIAN